MGTVNLAALEDGMSVYKDVDDIDHTYIVWATGTTTAQHDLGQGVQWVEIHSVDCRRTDPESRLTLYGADAAGRLTITEFDAGRYTGRRRLGWKPSDDMPRRR